MNHADELLTLASSDATLAAKAPQVSGWTIGQHVEHIALVNFHLNQRIVDALKTPPQNADQRPRFGAYIIFWFGYIPRGKAQAPTAVVPQGLSPDALRLKLKENREALAALESRLAEIETSRGRTPHPFLGMFTAKQWLRFIGVHNHHHLKIIRAIQKGS